MFGLHKCVPSKSCPHASSRAPVGHSARDQLPEQLPKGQKLSFGGSYKNLVHLAIIQVSRQPAIT